MLYTISQFPLFGFLLIIYNIISGTLFYSNPNDYYIDKTIISLTFPDNVIFSFTYIELWIITGLVILFIETIKHFQQMNKSIFEHIFAMFVFILFIIEFIFVPFATNTAFFIILLFSGVQMISGFVSTIIAARRDFSISETNDPKIKNENY